jgi:hypothetical protein
VIAVTWKATQGGPYAIPEIFSPLSRVPKRDYLMDALSRIASQGCLGERRSGTYGAAGRLNNPSIYSESRNGASVKLNLPLRRFLQAVILLSLVTVVVCWIEKDLLHLRSSSWYPFFERDWRFSDLTTFRERFQYFHQLHFFTMSKQLFAYPAPVAFAIQFFLLLGPYAVVGYLAFCVLVFVGSGVLVGHAMHRRGLQARDTIVFISVSLLLSYPLLFLLDRANIEMVNWLLVALGVAAYWKKRWYLAAIFLGVAISFKIFPFVFLGLLFSSKKYGAAVLGVVVAVATTALATWMLGPTYQIASTEIARGLEFYRTGWMLEIHPYEIGFDHSIYGFLKVLTFPGLQTQHEFYQHLLTRYMAVAATGGILLYFWKIRKLPRVNQILALTVASILFPPTSGDYTLMHLYIPWAALVLFAVSVPEARKTPGLVFVFVCLAILMTSQGYVVFHYIKLNGMIKMIVLLFLLFASVSYPFEEQLNDGEVEQAAGSHAADRHSLHSATV